MDKFLKRFFDILNCKLYSKCEKVIPTNCPGVFHSVFSHKQCCQVGLFMSNLAFICVEKCKLRKLFDTFFFCMNCTYFIVPISKENWSSFIIMLRNFSFIFEETKFVSLFSTVFYSKDSVYIHESLSLPWSRSFLLFISFFSTFLKNT